MEDPPWRPPDRDERGSDEAPTCRKRAAQGATGCRWCGPWRDVSQRSAKAGSRLGCPVCNTDRSEEGILWISEKGLGSPSLAFLVWGLAPLFWNLLSSVPALELLAHRIVWSIPLLFAIIAGRRRLGVLRDSFRSPGTAATAFAGGVLLSVNWGVFVWAVTADHIVDASLGYFINPLVSVALGVIVLREHLRPAPAPCRCYRSRWCCRHDGLRRCCALDISHPRVLVRDLRPFEETTECRPSVRRPVHGKPRSSLRPRSSIWQCWPEKGKALSAYHRRQHFFSSRQAQSRSLPWFSSPALRNGFRFPCSGFSSTSRRRCISSSGSSSSEKLSPEANGSPLPWCGSLSSSTPLTIRGPPRPFGGLPAPYTRWRTLGTRTSCSRPSSPGDDSDDRGRRSRCRSTPAPPR